MLTLCFLLLVMQEEGRAGAVNRHDTSLLIKLVTPPHNIASPGKEQVIQSNCPFCQL